jgi:hypothetical protein
MNHIKTLTAVSALSFIVILGNSAFAQSEGIIKYRKT